MSDENEITNKIIENQDENQTSEQTQTESQIEPQSESQSETQSETQSESQNQNDAELTSENTVESAAETMENSSAESETSESKPEPEQESPEKSAEVSKTPDASSSKKSKGKKLDIKDIKKVKKLRVNIGEGYEKLQSSVPALIITCAIAFIIMIGVCCAVFFANVKGPEQVLVPNVVGESLEDALIEMQVKELYPKINLRYSNNPADKGTILEQDPEAGTIVKGYSRDSLVVSRGVVVDAVGDYVGKNLDDVQMSLQTLFTGQLEPLIVLATPKYIPDTSDPGTILEQDPPEGYKISSPVTVQLVVSRGPNYENTRRPYVIGQNVNDLLQTIARSKIVFDITTHDASDDEKPGTVTSQETIESEFVPNYTRVAIEMAMPSEPADENVYGIFHENLTAYPYPIAMRLEAIPAEGNAYTILNFNHPGGNLTIPYAVPRGTTLVLYVADKAKAKKLVE